MQLVINPCYAVPKAEGRDIPLHAAQGRTSQGVVVAHRGVNIRTLAAGRVLVPE